MYEMYNPTVLEVEVIKLEKQLDASLYYPLILPLFTPLGMEIMYEMYNPTGLKVEVMELQKQLVTSLYYPSMLLILYPYRCGDHV